MATVWFNASLGTELRPTRGLGDVRDVASVIISYEQTRTESAVFKLWMLYFQKITFSDQTIADSLRAFL